MKLYSRDRIFWQKHHVLLLTGRLLLWIHAPSSKTACFSCQTPIDLWWVQVTSEMSRPEHFACSLEERVLFKFKVASCFSLDNTLILKYGSASDPWERVCGCKKKINPCAPEWLHPRNLWFLPEAVCITSSDSGPACGRDSRSTLPWAVAAWTVMTCPRALLLRAGLLW